jgi:hypothetical protein
MAKYILKVYLKYIQKIYIDVSQHSKEWAVCQAGQRSPFRSQPARDGGIVNGFVGNDGERGVITCP